MNTTTKQQEAQEAARFLSSVLPEGMRALPANCRVAVQTSPHRVIVTVAAAIKVAEQLDVLDSAKSNTRGGVWALLRNA